MRAGSAPIARILTTGFTKLLLTAATIGRDEPRILQVSVSAIAPSAPLSAPQAGAPNTADKTADPTLDASAGDASEAQPTPPPPLPPGQGTRVDQLA
jgi:hypothetical protein